MMLLASVVFLMALTGPYTTDATSSSSKTVPATATELLYTKLNLKDLGLSQPAYMLAIKGWQKMKAQGLVSKDIVSICDFSQSSNNKRLYIIDLASGKLLFNTLVAHGRNTGEEFAKYFSNEPSSYKSSLGFYTTKATYNGQHGLSLTLSGQEPGYNSNAESRAIVMHGADYVCNKFACDNGRLGRSLGCPAVSYEISAPIINTIKDGSCLFVYYPDNKYLAGSKILN